MMGMPTASTVGLVRTEDTRIPLGGVTGAVEYWKSRFAETQLRGQTLVSVARPDAVEMQVVGKSTELLEMAVRGE